MSELKLLGAMEESSDIAQDVVDRDPETETEHDAGTGEEDHEGTEEDESKPDSLTPQQRARHALTGRGVTLSMLMADGMIEPGEDNMSIEYLGQKFTADLLADGRIRWREEDKLFGSPSAWAIHCKKIVNPMKKSGCGWASVKYKGKKLNSFKSTWTRRQRPLSGLATASSNGNNDLLYESSEGEEPEEKKIKEETDDDISQYGGLKQEHRQSVPHGTLGRKSHLHDPNTLVECLSFSTIGKIQTFTVSMSTNAMLLMDFHCHLSGNEVVGYLGGKWDSNTQSISIEASFPCICTGKDKEIVEENIRQGMAERGLRLVGWYHSHPRSQPDPSLRDLETQLEYQATIGGPQTSYQPCLSLIVAPHDHQQYVKAQKESTIRVIWVMPPSEQRSLDYGLPMALHYDVHQDTYLPSDLLAQMKSLVDYYKSENELIDFTAPWQQNCTTIEKMKGSLLKKLPKEEKDGKLLDFLVNLLKEASPIPPEH